MSAFGEKYEQIVISSLCKFTPYRKVIKYGTAGFREEYDEDFEGIFFRMGIFAVFRSLHCRFNNGQACVGVMITASHNQESDNGIKLVDSDGGMLNQLWEPYAEKLANCEPTVFISELVKLCKSENIDINSTISNESIVMIGRDTRPHSKRLSDIVRKGIELLGGKCIDINEVTTPQLHFSVKEFNTKYHKYEIGYRGDIEISTYYSQLCEGYLELKRTAEPKNNRVSKVIVDASFGVGSIPTQSFLLHYKKIADFELDIDIRNAAYSGPVNKGCGAELVQKKQLPPSGVDKDKDVDTILCSFDGDADRIIFHGFIRDTNNIKWIMIDGDKIASLLSILISETLKEAKLNDKFTLAVIQTAYANGSSTKYLHSKGIQTFITKTGVKYLHHKAIEYDIGIYFEANGHGTVIFSEQLISYLNSLTIDSIAIKRLKSYVKVINQAVGDALSDMLCCLAALDVLNMSFIGWNEIYTDFPSKQLKVSVPDKSKIICSDDETTILQPKELQDDLNYSMSLVTSGRCFVRPSGTEDVVRIYAEAATVEEAERLAVLTEECIKKYLF